MQWLLLASLAVEDVWASQVALYGLNSCGSHALEQRLSSVAHGPVALWHVGSSQIRDRTHVSCIGRQILYPREVLLVLFLRVRVFLETSQQVSWVSLTSIISPIYL